MTHQRWLRIIPVALIMYTISYVDRTNISLALDPKISSMLRDLLMDDRMKGEAAGIFFLGYVLLQVSGGHLANRWSAKKLISLCLIFWGACAVGCGLAATFRQFAVMRFCLGMAESSVYPATVVLLAHWFPRRERARANALWNLCQPLAVVASAPFTGWLLGAYGWQTMLILEGALPFIWLPIWWFFISDHPREAKWISPAEREFLETTLEREAAELEPVKPVPFRERFMRWEILVMIVMNFIHNSQAYGCMTFFTEGLKHKQFSPLQYGLLFAVPYAVTAVIMVLNSWHSDKTQERRGTCRVGLYAQRRQPDRQRADATTFLALLRVHVSGHPRTVCRAGAILGNSHRNLAAQCHGSRHRTGQRHRKYRRIRRPVHRRLAGNAVSQHCDSLQRTGCRHAGGRRAGLSAAENRAADSICPGKAQSLNQAPLTISSGDFSQLKVSASTGGSSVANWLSNSVAGIKWFRLAFQPFFNQSPWTGEMHKLDARIAGLGANRGRPPSRPSRQSP